MAKCVLGPRRTRGGVFDSEALGRHSAVPSGLIAMPTFPALKRRAILMMSLRDKERSPTHPESFRWLEKISTSRQPRWPLGVVPALWDLLEERPNSRGHASGVPRSA